MLGMPIQKNLITSAYTMTCPIFSAEISVFFLYMHKLLYLMFGIPMKNEMILT